MQRRNFDGASSVDSNRRLTGNVPGFIAKARKQITRTTPRKILSI
jgi:hypothetical protein